MRREQEFSHSKFPLPSRELGLGSWAWGQFLSSPPQTQLASSPEEVFNLTFEQATELFVSKNTQKQIA